MYLVHSSAHVSNAPRHGGLLVAFRTGHLDADVIAASCLPVAKAVTADDRE